MTADVGLIFAYRFLDEERGGHHESKIKGSTS